MGNLESPYVQVTALYNDWLGFITVLDFFWADQYDAMAGPNRKSRRVMEEENKKLRMKARKEYTHLGEMLVFEKIIIIIIIIVIIIEEMVMVVMMMRQASLMLCCLDIKIKIGTRGISRKFKRIPIVMNCSSWSIMTQKVRGGIWEAGGRRRRGRRQEEEHEKEEKEAAAAEIMKAEMAEKSGEAEEHGDAAEPSSHPLPVSERLRKQMKHRKHSKQAANKKSMMKKENASKPKAASKERTQKMAGDGSDNMCEKCGEQFETRNKLYKHL